MIVLNLPVFICMLFVQVTNKNFPGGTLLAHFPGRRPFGRRLTHNDYQTLAAMTSEFLQIGIIVFDESGQTCPKYPLFSKYIKKLLQLLLCSIVMQNIQIFHRVPVMFISSQVQQLCGLWSKLMLFY